MDLLLKDKIILVTGASKGLGFSCAKLIVEEGAKVIISSRSTSNLNIACSKIKESTGTRPHIFAADTGKPSQIEKLRDWILEEFGKVDGLIINSGGPPTGGSLSFNDDEWQSSFDNNLLSAVRLTKAFIPSMKQQGYGRIVAITSISAKQPLDNLVLSNTMRLGVIGYLKTLSNEVASNNILVNIILPGLTRTERLESVMKKWAENEGKTLEEVIKSRTGQIPVGRLGNPEELAALACFLISGKNTYITGQTIAVDGGFIKSAL